MFLVLYLLYAVDVNVDDYGQDCVNPQFCTQEFLQLFFRFNCRTNFYDCVLFAILVFLICLAIIKFLYLVELGCSSLGIIKFL